MPEKPKVTVRDLLGNDCRYCEIPVTVEAAGSITHSYWNADPFICHKACKDAGVKQEALDCQVIDASCNDCYYYRRGRLAAKTTTLIKKPDGSIGSVSHQPNVFVGGHCLKFDRPTLAFPNKWSGLECFEHRRQHN